MTYLDLVTAALYHGLTLILPISGDDIAQHLFPWAKDPTLAQLLKSIAMVGSGMGLLAALSNEMHVLFRSTYLALKRRQEGSFTPMLMLLTGSVPLIVLDCLDIPKLQAGGWIIASIFIAIGILFYVADKLGVTVRELDHLSLFSYLMIGILLALGSLVGIAGQIIAISLARLMGCERDQAIKLAWICLLPHFFLGLRVILTSALAPPLLDSALTGTLSLFVTLAAAGGMLVWLKRRTFAAFAIGQIVIGFLLMLSVARFGG
jgi:undecaprenyl-diphosphatase